MTSYRDAASRTDGGIRTFGRAFLRGSRAVAAVALACGIGGCGDAPPPPVQQPLSVAEMVGGAPACPDCDVVLITLDTVRADSLPCYGGAQATAPEICGYADQHLLFENAYSPAPSTFPALRSVLSGSVVANEPLGEVLAHYEQQRYLAELLADRGYVTAAMTDHRGFGTERRAARVAAPMLRGFDTFVNVGTGIDDRTSDVLTDAALEWLDRTHGEPYFLWLHYFDPHFNYMPPADLARDFGFDPDGCGRITNGIPIQRVREIEDDLTERELSCLVALHHAEIRFTDAQVGRVLRAVQSRPGSRDALVLIAADHGEEFLERSRIGHERTVYNELIRVPLVVGMPGGPRGVRVSEPVSTLLVRDLVRWTVLGDPAPAARRVVSRTAHYYGPIDQDLEGVRSLPNQFTLVRGSEKVVLRPHDGSLEYYDLDVDPGERSSRPRSPRALSLRRELESWLESNTARSTAPSREALEGHNEETERLKALGYIR